MLLYCDDVSSITDEQFSCFFEIMPEERQQKVLRYRKAEGRQLGVVAYALLLYAMHRNGYKPEECKLAYGENGKPYFKNCPIKFNISHTKNAVACAVSQNEIGVDIQIKYPDYIRVMGRVCCENEIKYISDSKNPVDDFAKLWTLKESYVKYKGTGISDTLSQYDFSYVDERGCSACGCEFLTLDGEKYTLSVCSNPKIGQISKISLHELYNFFSNMM